ncbi:MAG: putative lipid II flippase FtsW [Gemmatimonadota bacterium]
MPSLLESGSLRASRQVLLIALILVGFGTVIVYSSSSVLAGNRFSDTGFFLERQLFRALLGLALMFGASRVPLAVWRKLARPLLLAGLGLLVLVLLMGVGRGTQRWLPVPVPLVRAGLSFQPSEFVKLVLVVYLADVLVRKGDSLAEWKAGFLPRVAVIAGVLLLILLQPDLGTATAIGAVSVVMLWLGGARTAQVASLGLAAVPVGVISLVRSPYQLERLMSFLHGADPQGAGFQVNQSLLALGSGGLLGVGLGNSIQKYYLPEAHTDFVFAFVGEELGLFGTLSVLALLAALAIHGVLIARHASTDHGYLLAAGITIMITANAMINMGVATGLLPTTGLPLPFISYGGSSLVWNLTAVGILAGVAREQRLAGAAVPPAEDGPPPGGSAGRPLTRRRSGARLANVGLTRRSRGTMVRRLDRPRPWRP